MTRHIFYIGQRVTILATGDPKRDDFMAFVGQTGTITHIWRVKDGEAVYDMFRVAIGDASVDVIAFDIEPA